LVQPRSLSYESFRGRNEAESSSATKATTGSSTPISPNSPLYDPRTNEPAGLRAVLDGLKRMEVQITNIENDMDGIKNVVKKIRESNGTAEKRLNKIEDYADTMQQDLYLTMDMVRCLTEALSEQKKNSTADEKENSTKAV
jgi:hypothetical protein